MRKVRRGYTACRHVDAHHERQDHGGRLGCQVNKADRIHNNIENNDYNRANNVNNNADDDNADDDNADNDNNANNVNNANIDIDNNIDHHNNGIATAIAP